MSKQDDGGQIDPMQDPMRPGYFMNYAENETEAEQVLRQLACWLGVGGYNAPTVDAKVFHEKIVWGVENLIAETKASPVRQDQSEPWSGWACQYPGKLPRLYGAREIAEVNLDTANGDRLIFLADLNASSLAHKRDLFAMAALEMLGAAAHEEGITSLEDRAADTARACYTIADAFMKARQS